MTIRELIELLKQAPENNEVVIRYDDGTEDAVESLDVQFINDTAWLSFVVSTFTLADAVDVASDPHDTERNGVIE